MIEDPSWPREVADRLNSTYGAGPYRVLEIVPKVADESQPSSVDLRVTLRGVATQSVREALLEGWQDDVESLESASSEAEIEAFVLLLHANLDEAWSMMGGGD